MFRRRAHAFARLRRKRRKPEKVDVYAVERARANFFRQERKIAVFVHQLFFLQKRAVFFQQQRQIAQLALQRSLGFFRAAAQKSGVHARA